MTYLSVEQLSKQYREERLFEGITFGISKGDKTALVAPNGTGKSTLLKILAGKESADTGEVMIRNGIRTGFLEQEPELDDRMSIREFINKGSSQAVEIIRRYEEAAKAQAESFNEETQNRFEMALAAMDAANAWDYEQRMQQILGRLNIHELNQPISSLSGGERKRVALAFVLIENPDLLLLDEPTNHLDIEMVEWLEQYLARSAITLLMVTHDRYFLDRVCNHIIEIDAGKLYHHKGNYAWYLQKKAERQEVEDIAAGKAGQLLKKELEWMRRSPKARTTKSKSRVSAFYETEEKANQGRDEAELRLEMNMQRMGSKILELSGVNKRFGDTLILNDFSCSFKRGERIGIIGRNGVGKSTFLDILTGQQSPDSGHIDRGSTIVYGHYRQQGVQVDESMRVIDLLKEIAEVIELSDGKKVSASRFLEHFMFTPEMQYTPVSRLSGGERRRLGLMMVLIQQPNFLILDEPTNDLDLTTMQRLEDFLLDFGGCLIVVSHDRFFMDKLVDHYFIFEGDGVIWDHNGTYLEYREQLAVREMEEKSGPKESKTPDASKPKGKSERAETPQKGLTFRQKQEQQSLEEEIQELEEEKVKLGEKIGANNLPYKELEELSTRFGKVERLIEEKSIRWLELAEKEPER